MILLAIDPGRNTGWAAFSTGAVLLRACGKGEPPLEEWPPDQCIIECPQVYPNQKKRIDPNDLIKVAVMVGRYAGRAEAQNARVELVLPHAWKGSVPKAIHNRRILAALHPAERVLAGGQRHDVIDAIGLGLWKLGRL